MPDERLSFGEAFAEAVERRVLGNVVGAKRFVVLGAAPRVDRDETQRITFVLQQLRTEIAAGAPKELCPRASVAVVLAESVDMLRMHLERPDVGVGSRHA